MKEKKDLQSREDIVKLLEKFYNKAFKDDLIGHFFTEVVPLNLETHIPVIADFWEAVIFTAHNYRKNVMEVHQAINRQSAISKQHLDKWVDLFTETINELFEGEKATLMIQRAKSIATLMDIKLNHNQIKF